MKDIQKIYLKVSLKKKRKNKHKPVGLILQSIKDGTSESQYFHLFGDPGLKVPMPSDTLISLEVTPDTLKTLERGTYFGQPIKIDWIWGRICFLDRCR